MAGTYFELTIDAAYLEVRTAAARFEKMGLFPAVWVKPMMT